jgi:hypothetical protein
MPISATSSASLLDTSVTTSLTAGQTSPLKSTIVSTGSTADNSAKFKTDLKAEAGNTISLNSVAKDVTSLFKDLTSGNSTAAKADANKTSADLQTQQASTATGNQAFSSLESLVIKISDALSAGAIQSAVQYVAGYLVQHGQATGSLINLSV